MENSIRESNIAELGFIAWQDHLLQKQKRRIHWINQSSENAAIN